MLSKRERERRRIRMLQAKLEERWAQDRTDCEIKPFANPVAGGDGSSSKTRGQSQTTILSASSSSSQPMDDAVLKDGTSIVGKYATTPFSSPSPALTTTGKTSSPLQRIFSWNTPSKRLRPWESPASGYVPRPIDPKWLDPPKPSSSPRNLHYQSSADGQRPANVVTSTAAATAAAASFDILPTRRMFRSETSTKQSPFDPDDSTDDDTGNVTYGERPLETSARSNKQLCFPWTSKNSTMNDLDSDDSDDDGLTERFLASLKAKEAQQSTSTPDDANRRQSSSNSISKNNQSQECDIQEFTPTQTDNIENSSDDEEDEKKPPPKTIKRNSHLNDSVGEASSDKDVGLPMQVRSSRVSNASSLWDDDETDDKKELRLSAKKQRRYSSMNSVPHNPIALARHEAERIAQATENIKSFSRAAGDNALWSDSDPEEELRSSHGSKNRGREKLKKRGFSTYKGRASSVPSAVAKVRVNPTDDFLEEDPRLQDFNGFAEEDLQDQLHPEFDDPKFVVNAMEPLVLEQQGGDHRHEVPAALNRYLADFQKEGVRFMYSCLVNNMGSILGDDMGCGKTVQVLSLLSALFNKKGNGEDVLKLKRREKLVKGRVEQEKNKMEEALMHGKVLDPRRSKTSPSEEEVSAMLGLPKGWWPILIVVPPTVFDNWQNEISKFTHLSVALYDGTKKERAISQIVTGMAEIMLMKMSTFQNQSGFREVISMPVKWKLVVIDEFHMWKNVKSKWAQNLRALKSKHQNLVLAMTGTLMSNDHKELWNLVDLVETDYLGSWDEFKIQVAEPIKLGRSKNASRGLIEMSEAKARALQEKLKKILIERKKEDVLVLPEKKEKAVMCELSPLQIQVYRHIIGLPDFELVKTAASPCDCGVNAGFFQRIHRLETAAQRVQYYREHKSEIIKRCECCYTFPRNPRYQDGGQEPEVNPDAVIWRLMKAHASGETCERCPYCCGLPALTKLYKLGDHLALLQAKEEPGADQVGSLEYITFKKDLEFAKVALHHVVDQLPRQSYIRQPSMVDDHFALSGKLRVLDKLLETFSEENAKTLLFSYSTQMLDLIQNYLRAKGHSFLRMDGKTTNSLRQGMADEFNNDPTKFIFLLSTRAMGVGLNLTSASKVIIFDVEWNPANDQQAQDRAYRIGQKSNVEVFRLIAQGTIDELKYLRQLYKLQLKQETLVGGSSANPKAARLFRGVQGHKERKGELFGYENLFRFKHSSFLSDIWKQTGRRNEAQNKKGLVIHEASKLTDILLGIEAEKLKSVLSDEGPELEQIAYLEPNVMNIDELAPQVNHNEAAGNVEVGEEEIRDEFEARAIDHHDLFRADRGRAAVEEGEEGFDEEMGGGTQNMVAIYEGGAIMPENPQDGSLECIDVEEQSRTSTTSPVVGIDEVRSHQIGVSVNDVLVQADEQVIQLEEPEWMIQSDSDASTHHGESVDSSSRMQKRDSVSSAGDNPYPADSELPLDDGAMAADNVTNPISSSSIAARRGTAAVKSGRKTSGMRAGVGPPNVNLFGTASTRLRDSTTIFSKNDIFLPSYKIKRTKSSKKC